MPTAALLGAMASLPIVPLPVSVVQEPGFVTRMSSTVSAPAECQGAVNWITSHIPSRQRPAVTIRLTGGAASEAYSLSAKPSGVTIIAASPSGAFYGAVTLSQMARMGKVPCAEIEDQPRFGWRGMHLDVSRHFFSADEIKKYIDYLAEYKFNVFHWHLVDDGGWRLEIKKYPTLTDVGAWRTATPGVMWGGPLEFPGKGSGKDLYGGYYTQDQVRDIVKYAQARNITIVPEIEMPGHSMAATAALPQIACTLPAGVRSNVFCAGKDESLTVLKGILDEVMDLFPSQFIHIGGDEVDKSYWSQCPDCKARMSRQGLKDYNELQSWFIRQMDTYLVSKGRALIGWDEILEGGLAPNAAVMSWRGISGGIQAAKANHRVVMSPTSHCYFDFSYDSTSTVHAYSYEPVPYELNDEEAKLVLGAQANVWTEWIPDFHRVEYMVFPRFGALAEAVWTPKERKNYTDFDRRIRTHAQWWAKEGISFYMEPPRAPMSLIMFDKKASVPLNPPIWDGVELRYSINQPLTQKTGRAYSGPIEMTGEGVIRAANFISGKPTGTPLEVTCLKYRPVQPDPAIRWRLYKGVFNNLPDFDRTPVSDSGTGETMTIDPFRSLDTFAVEWQTTFTAEKEGLYRFALGSDDGSALWLNGAKVINNDYAQAFTERTGTAYLVKGTYAMKVGFFERGGAEGFLLRVRGPEGGERTLGGSRP